MRAYHAGAGEIRFPSLLNSISPYGNYANSYSIGIENINNGRQPYSLEQIKQNLRLCDYLCDTIPSLKPHLMIPHADWTMRKMDTGPFFDWELFANAIKASEYWDYPIKRNYGIFPKNKVQVLMHIDLSTYRIYDPNIELISKIQLQLYKIGYVIDKEEMDKASFGITTKHAVFKVNIKYFGQEIIKTPDLLEAWYVITDDTKYTTEEKNNAQEHLSFLSYEMEEMLGNVIEQYEQYYN